jgi:hypothetical protein
LIEKDKGISANYQEPMLTAYFNTSLSESLDNRALQNVTPPSLKAFIH